ncbi:MAG: glycosyltransferase [Synergistaceae bacterium]|nr:glycosyltransferase [Synergistaceae bacterium]
MKVLLVDVNCKNSSTGKIVYDLYTGLNKRGIEAAVCYGRGPLIKEKNIFKFGIDLETYFHALMTRITGLTGFFSFFSTYRLIKFMKKFDPDVVHLHELHAYFVNYGTVIKYLKKNNIKTVWTFHCEFMYTGKCGYAYECDKWQTECNQCPQLRNYPKSLFFDFTKEMYSYKKSLMQDFDNLVIVTPSEWLANRVKSSFLHKLIIKVIHNGIDTENIFYPRDTDVLRKKIGIRDEKIVLAVAPDIMSCRKGGTYVLQLAKRFNDGKVKFVMVGMTDEDLHETYPNNVIPVGLVKDQYELATLYSLANVFVICSEKENYPTVCLEAQACGAVICGFDVGGTKETAPLYYENFVKFGEIDALEIKVKSALYTITTATSYLNTSDFSIFKMVSDYLELYKIINENK